MTRLLATTTAALVALGTSFAFAQNVPGSDAAVRAHESAQRLQVATGYPEAAREVRQDARTFGYPALSTGADSGLSGSRYFIRQSEEATRASVQNGTDGEVSTTRIGQQLIVPGSGYDAF